jgi:glycosidase
MSKILCRIILASLVFSLPWHAQAQADKRTSRSGEVIYHVFLRSFYDSNGDLHGDFNGLRQKLDYIQDLGATAILLLPLYEADCYHNYFANDFEKMDPEFGTFEEYVLLVKELHKRNMKVYMDMETQYVTYKHVWYTQSINNLSSPYSNYLLFDDAAHTIPSTMVFGLRELVSYDGKVVQVTTVNLKSKDVLNYNVGLFRYFMDPNKDGVFDDGVDGFRLDHAMNNLDDKQALTNLFVEFWNPLIRELKKTNPLIRIVGEQADWNDYGYDYFARAGVDEMFGFGLQRAILSFNKQQLIHEAEAVLIKTPAGKGQVIFLENHDLDRFASLETNLQKQKLAASLQFLVGGIPSIYYGQEIGMKGKGANGQYGNGDGNDIPRREAFEWFKTTEAKGMTTWYANTGPWWVNRYIKDNDGISVEEQQGDPNSLLNHYKRMIKLRSSSEVLSAGAYAPVENNNDFIFSFVRTKESKSVLIAANLSDQSQKVQLKRGKEKYVTLDGQVKIINGQFELKPYQVAVWEVK